MENKILEIIKDESEKAGVRKHTCINEFGYSQFERNIAERVAKLLDTAGDDKLAEFRCSDKENRYRVELINELIDVYENPENSNTAYKDAIVGAAREKGYGYEKGNLCGTCYKFETCKILLESDAPACRLYKEK